MPAARRQDYLLLLALAALWGSSFLLIKLAVATLPPVTVAAARILIGALALLLLLRLGGGRLPDPGLWPRFLALGALGMLLPFALINWGETRIDSALAAILMSVIPAATLVLAHFFTRDEPIAPPKLAGVGLGFAGVLLLVGPAALARGGADLAGQLAILAAALCYAATGVAARRMPPMPPEAMGAAMLLAAGFVGLPAAMLLDEPWRLSPSAGSLAAVLALGLLPTAGGYWLFFRLLGRAGAGFTALNNYLVPVAGVFWGAALLNERPSPRALVALLLILTGIALPRLWAARGSGAR